ncbi:MAG TPA: ribosome recycling factor [Alphaproteobacteria bacterium]|nr:ribosome recycling factor [Alphaproteobacteria bacterium]
MPDINEVEKRMKGAVENFKHNLAGLRTGRASVALVDNLRVEVYGSMMPLNQCANISVPEPRTLSISVWDKGNVSAVEKAIQTSNLGLNPQTEGTVIRLNLPDLTEERRKELVKVAHQYAENARIAIRNVRRDGIEHAKREEKEDKITEDVMKGISNRIQDITDKQIEAVDKMLKDKEAEILKV